MQSDAGKGVTLATILEEVRPGFKKRHEDFVQFLTLTLEDLKGKHLSISTQCSMLRGKVKVRHYLSCQLYMLQKHIRRLRKFDEEVSNRLTELVGRNSRSGASKPSSSTTSYRGDDSNDVGQVVMGTDPQNAPSISMRSDGRDLSTVSSCLEVQGSVQDPIILMEADMVKMKRRCKQMLDVTDKYCVLNSQTDLYLEIEEVNEGISKHGTSPPLSPWISKSPTGTVSLIVDSIDGADAESLSNSNDNEELAVPQKLPSTFKSKGAVHMTLESLASHTRVILKSYTNKHSHS